MDGPSLAATISLDSDLKVTGGVVQFPQDYRFTTDFEAGPDGYLLRSVRTDSTSGDKNGESTFAFTYQAVDGIQLPNEVTVSPPTSEPWHFTLVDCKVVHFVTVKVVPPPSAH
jgi:hypothetical protein